MKTLALLTILLTLACLPGLSQTGSGYTLLPENLAFFTATRVRGNVSLEWQTVNEQNSKGFKVQRKTNGGWETLAFVPTNAVNGSSAAKVYYSYTDANSFKGVTQYQVIETTNDLKQKSSEIRAVRSEGQSSRLTVYPNPSPNGQLTVVFENNDAKTITVSDLSGRAVKQFSGVTSSTLSIENLSPGFYHIRVTDLTTNEIFVEKVMVSKG